MCANRPNGFASRESGHRVLDARHRGEQLGADRAGTNRRHPHPERRQFAALDVAQAFQGELRRLIDLERVAELVRLTGDVDDPAAGLDEQAEERVHLARSAPNVFTWKCRMSSSGSISTVGK